MNYPAELFYPLLSVLTETNLNSLGSAWKNEGPGWSYYMNKFVVRRTVKRALQSAYDNCEGQKHAAQLKLHTLRENFESYNIQSIVDQRDIIDKCEIKQKQIAAEYKELFSKDMPSTYSDEDEEVE